ncbi:MAG TPA: isoleucine--tRNA ligase [Phycisphaerales bacterium]|nr:isoleucine--tRNA ligase [Phycisphaerales bacterium]HRQ76850.1 isoleucine--tRNA ligase [Phycisphaerales bacterium]
MTEATKKTYKQTLNLPQTPFPMRANLAQNEPQSQKRWENSNLYAQAIAAREAADSPRFVFHDGPPYANASLHVGHLLNKVLKDFVVRSKLMAGNLCPYIPGWDCHGLPIEHRVMTELIESGKAAKLDTLTEDQRRMAVRRECAKHAEKSIQLQMSQMKRMLTLADYEHPYLTMLPEYEGAVLDVFATLVERGLVYRALKPVHWSIANQTALAEAELEYEDREDPSIYVDFEVAAGSKSQVEQAFGVELDQTPSLMIWTTTPWTLPANLAIAVHPRYRYALVQVDGNISVIARELAEKVTKIGKAEDVQVLAECDGSALVGVVYRHPFIEREGRIVAAEYVTLEDGTGLVHTAPGHGQEDYQTGLREGLDIYCPVKADGTFDDTAPKWLRGVSVWDANEKVMAHLRESGHLFHSHRFTHSYPHDWRSKTPVIFRATEQWFVGVDMAVEAHGLQSVGLAQGASLRARALDVVANAIKFIPEWGRNRMRGMLESRPDWCLSRQRAWGLPIPAFALPDGTIFMTAASVRAVAKVFAARGSDAWFTESPEQLLEQYDPASDIDLKSQISNLKSSLTKLYDIFDVWFESGSSWHAVVCTRGMARETGPATDLYLEGSDQHRGWFQLSLLPALGVTGHSPFASVLTHGFMVDKDGRKMSKSGGNALDVDTLLKDFGADVCRWWVSSLPYENDIKVDLSFFEQAGESYRKVRNTLRFLLSNLYDFKCTPNDPGAGGVCGDCVDFSRIAPTSIDAFILEQAAALQKRVVEAYETYQFRRAHQLLYDFCNDTLSALYCVAVKDRLYCDAPRSLRRRTSQTVMWMLTEMLCRLLAPLLPHTADEAYRTLWGDDSKTVHLETLFAFEFAADADWSTVLEAREAALKALEDAKSRGIENPLDAEIELPDPRGTLGKFAADLPDLLGVSRVRFSATATSSTVSDLREEPRCERSWKRDGTVKQRSDGGWLTDRDAEAVGVA